MKDKWYALLLTRDENDNDEWHLYNDRNLEHKLFPFEQSLFENTLEQWLDQFLW